MMATRQAYQRVSVLPRLAPRITIASAAACAASRTFARISSAVAVRPLASLPAPAWRSGSGGGLRWYSGSADNQVPNSRIWAFDEIKALVTDKDSKEKVVVVDVREPSELFETGKIPGAINIPITSAVQSFHISDEDFEDLYGYSRPPKDASLLFYCRAGVRARAAAGLAQHAGWASVGEYPGSWIDWDMNKGPVEVVKQGSKDNKTE
ncbi:Rhodanese-like domain-containing protein [Trichoderma ceciliae]